MANTMNSPLRNVLEQWCGEGSLEGTSFMSKDVGDTCFIWVEPVTLGNNELFPSYFSNIDDLQEALVQQPERQISEAIISTPRHYLRLLTDTGNLLAAEHQPCFVLHKTLDESAEQKPVERKVYSQQELDIRFSQKAQEANPSLNKQRWVFKQQGSALFFNGETASESNCKEEGGE
ncbi:hypothetical protein KIH87_11810 [Paraneptunicella aestuarii]|uniref:hypothetical protein n=1 Tax=Paraneptunicella aestuarii TaxID=2831148 RepID=UPI001E33CB78|nr:hypothetical protein [Paraneptunicella aestuarii]UAA37400.1 hypothetical protein KIH87_11810 [Paraneptunicella aestuarii]